MSHEERKGSEEAEQSVRNKKIKAFIIILVILHLNI